MTPQPSEQPTTGTPCRLCGGVMYPGHHCRATNPILHWPNDPRIPRCNENCHRAERKAAAPDPVASPLEAAPDWQVANVGEFLERQAADRKGAVATGEPMPMRMRTALSAFEAWAEAVIPMLENAGDTEAAAYGRDRIEQSENARTTVRRWSAPAPVASPAPLDARTFLESLRSPRNSLGKLALPKGPMEWAVEDTWNAEDGVTYIEPTRPGEERLEVRSLSEFADALLTHLQERLDAMGQPVAEEPARD